jgi:hypothetical protein
VRFALGFLLDNRLALRLSSGVLLGASALLGGSLILVIVLDLALATSTSLLAQG